MYYDVHGVINFYLYFYLDVILVTTEIYLEQMESVFPAIVIPMVLEDVNVIP